MNQSWNHSFRLVQLGDITGTMVDTSRDSTRRKRPKRKGTPVMVRLQPDELNSLDKWIDSKCSSMSRPEAFRRMLHSRTGRRKKEAQAKGESELITKIRRASKNDVRDGLKQANLSFPLNTETEVLGLLNCMLDELTGKRKQVDQEDAIAFLSLMLSDSAHHAGE